MDDSAMARSLKEAMEAPEVEVFPGVFMTDFRSRNAAQRSESSSSSSTHNESKLSKDLPAEKDEFDDMNDQELLSLFSKLRNTLELINSPQNQFQVIEYDIKEMETQIEHLKRSNTEILNAMKTDTDPILKEAVEENLKVIVAKKHKVTELKELRDTLRQSEHYQEASDPSPTSLANKRKQGQGGGAADLLDEDYEMNVEEDEEDNSDKETEGQGEPVDEEEGIFL